MRILNASYLLNVLSRTPKIKTGKINAPGVTVSCILSRNPYIAELRY